MSSRRHHRGSFIAGLLAPALIGATSAGCGDDAALTGGAGGAASSSSPATSTSTGEGGASGTGGAAGDGGSAPGAGGGGGGGGAPLEPPDFDDAPWKTGDDVGFGVASKDTGNPLGDHVFIGYAGYGAALEPAQLWVEELYRAALEQRGVRHVFAVQGPLDVNYLAREIGNSSIAAALVDDLVDEGTRITVVGHSSGTFVAHELLGQLAGELDPGAVTAGRIDYVNLDGGSAGLTGPIVDHLASAWFVAAADPATFTWSPNQPTMASLGATYAAAGGYLEVEAAPGVCTAGAVWCLHMVPITTRPHSAAAASVPLDYESFDGREVEVRYLDAF